MDQRAPDSSHVTSSIVISSRNRPQFLVDVVGSVLSGDEVPTELVVVDQSDVKNVDLEQWPADPRSTLRYLWQPARGLSLGRNTGIEAATGEVVAFLDDDMVVPADWFGNIVAALIGAGRRTVVTGRVVAGEAESPGCFAPSLILDDKPAVYSGRPGWDVLSPMNMALFRSAFEEVGLFDARLGAGTRFPSSEDNDFGFRLLEAGFDILYRPDVVVAHRAWRKPGALLPLRWDYGRGQGAYYAKYASWRDTYMLHRLIWDVSRHLRRVPRRLIRAPRDGMADLVYALAVLTGMAHWFVSRPPHE
jgi:GT2 family glycosyltransferase